MRPVRPQRPSRDIPRTARGAPLALVRLLPLAIGLVLALSPTAPVRAQDAADPAPRTIRPADEPGRSARRKSPLPLWAGPALERGETLPPPFGIGVVAVQDQEGVFGDHLSVRLAKGQTPSPDATLVSVTPVTFDNVGATRSLQIKADVWVFPFLNLFASLGKVDGDVAIDVVIDADQLPPPPICRPAAPCGIKHLNFTTPLDNTTTTVGATLAYGTKGWFMGLTGSRTISIADTDRSDIKSTNVGLRGGPRLTLNDRVQLEPYLGVSYFRLDTEVKGVASLANAFPDGDALVVRYDARIRNTDDHSLMLGFNAQFGERVYLQGEYGHADSGDRFILSTTYRF